LEEDPTYYAPCPGDGSQSVRLTVLHAEAALPTELLNHLWRDAVEGLTRSVSANVDSGSLLSTGFRQSLDDDWIDVNAS
jgi:hypothetical protein